MRRRFVVLLCLALCTLGVTALFQTAQADTDPPPGVPATVSAKPLPTVQIDGVAWSQAIIGNTVYVAGEFTAARPPGAPDGQDEVRRSNLLAYDITTGLLVERWSPAANGPVQVIRASPDGSRLYVGGSFTTIDGKKRSRIAALDPGTGALVPGFKPAANSTVRAIVATDTTVWFGGHFSAVEGVARTRLASVRASDGALLTWAPTAANGRVLALALSPDGKQVLVGGAFTSLNGSSNPGYGLGAVNASSGALKPWAANSVVRNGGPDAGITSLTSDGTGSVYATGFVFGSTGNLEGAVKMSWNGGAVQWLEDCHGDSYDAYPAGSSVYVVGHPHYCGNLTGGFPQPPKPWKYYRGLAFTTAPRDTLRPNYLPGYADFAGQPAPGLLQWFPRIDAGTFTGQSQGAWSITGNRDYVVIGGEFPRVGNLAQQGLARFPRAGVDPVSAPIEGSASSLTPTLRSTGGGQVLVSWPTTWDRDTERLTYSVVRDDDVDPVEVRTISSTEWNEPDQGFIDTGLTPGSTVTYRIVVRDGTGNQVRSAPASVTVAGGDPTPAYPRTVAEDGPLHYWRFSETSGSSVADYPLRAAGTLVGNVTRNAPGVLAGDPAATFDGASTMYSAGEASQAPYSYTVEAWFRTTSVSGGKIVGFGNAQSTDSTDRTYDRQLYLDAAGRVNFGTKQGKRLASVTGSSPVNDGQWHHAVGVASEDGMKLYVDGALVASRADVRVGAGYPGWWRVGGDTVTGYAGDPPSDYFAGSIDEVAVYGYPLSEAQVAEHYRTATGQPVNQPPVASFTTGTNGLSATVDASASTDDGSITSYSWSWGDGTPAGSGPTASHTYARAGTYPVTLTVSDDAGAASTSTKQVSVALPPVVAAADSFRRSVARSWGTADTGGRWSTQGSGKRSVTAGRGVLELARGNAGWNRLGVSAANVDGTVNFTLDKRPGKGGVQVATAARATARGEYRFRVALTRDRKVRLSVSKVVGSRQTRLGAARTVPVKSDAGRVLRLRFQVMGAKTSTLRATVWKAGSVQPAAQVVRKDSTARLRAAGGIGLYGQVSRKATNAPVRVEFDNLRVRDLG